MLWAVASLAAALGLRAPGCVVPDNYRVVANTDASLGSDGSAGTAGVGGAAGAAAGGADGAGTKCGPGAWQDCFPGRSVTALPFANAARLRVGRLNSDARDDVAVAELKTTGAASEATSYLALSADGAPHALGPKFDGIVQAVTDVDGSGGDDLLISDPAGLRLRFQTASATFSAPSTLWTHSQPGGVLYEPPPQLVPLRSNAVSDFLFHSSPGQDAGTFSRLVMAIQNDGTGMLGKALIQHTSNDGLLLMLAGDFDCDGDRDVVHAEGFAKQEILLHENTGSQFAFPVVAAPMPSDALGLEVADVNKDGCADLLLSVYQVSGFVVLHGSASGFSKATPFKGAPARVVALSLVDLNEDGWPDAIAVVSTGLSTTQTVLMWNDGQGRFVEYDTLPEQAQQVGVGLFDDDARADLVLATAYELVFYTTSAVTASHR